MLPWFSPGLSQNVRNFGQNKAAPGTPNTAVAPLLPSVLPAGFSHGFGQLPAFFRFSNFFLNN